MEGKKEWKEERREGRNEGKEGRKECAYVNVCDIVQSVPAGLFSSQSTENELLESQPLISSRKSATKIWKSSDRSFLVSSILFISSRVHATITLYVCRSVHPSVLRYCSCSNVWDSLFGQRPQRADVL